MGPGLQSFSCLTPLRIKLIPKNPHHQIGFNSAMFLEQAGQDLCHALLQNRLMPWDVRVLTLVDVASLRRQAMRLVICILHHRFINYNLPSF